jgi:hypothetical protein
VDLTYSGAWSTVVTQAAVGSNFGLH